MGQPGRQELAVERAARQGEPACRVPHLDEGPLQDPRLPGTGRRIQDRQPMAGLDGVNQPSNRLLVPGKRNVRLPWSRNGSILNPQ